MKATLKQLLMQSPASYVERANCFNAVQLFWKDSTVQEFVGAEDFIEYIEKSFYQIPLDIPLLAGDVSIVWSRNSLDLPHGQIDVNQLVKKQPGYPFGLIIEHAYCHLEDGRVFQKPNPNLTGFYEVIAEDKALAPYTQLQGYEVTRHRRF
ncbi:MAG: hypothetical protein ACK5Y2_04015 [Bdellovibrionales bacterium]